MELLCVPFIILGNIFSQNIIYNLLTHKVIKLQYKKYEILIFNYRNIDVNPFYQFCAPSPSTNFLHSWGKKHNLTTGNIQALHKEMFLKFLENTLHII